MELASLFDSQTAKPWSVISAPHMPSSTAHSKHKEPDDRKHESGGSVFREPTLNPRQAVLQSAAVPK